MGAYVPAPYIEVGFGSGPYTDPVSITWTDITAYCDGFDTQRGRDNELDAFGAGTASFTLDNDDRRFDPLNTASPYFGSLVANTPIRVRADVGGTFYPIWSGYVDSWPAEYDEGGFNRTLELQCSDAFKVLGERSSPDTMQEDIEGLIGAGVLTRWYRFDRVINGEQVIRDNIVTDGSTDLHVYGKWDGQERVSAASGYGALGHAATQNPANELNQFYAAGNLIGPFNKAPMQSDHWAVAFSFRITDQGDLRGSRLNLVSIVEHTPGDPDPPYHFRINLHQGWLDGSGFGKHSVNAPACPGCIQVDVATAGTPNFGGTGPGDRNDLTGGGDGVKNTLGTFNPFDGNAHTLVLWRQAGQVELWVDGVQVYENLTGGAVGTPTWRPGFELRVYWPWVDTVEDQLTTTPGVAIQDLMMFHAVNLATFNPVDVHDALMVGMSQVTDSGNAVYLLLNRLGWPFAARDIDTGEVKVATVPNPYGNTPLELLQQYADSEGGRLFVGADGRVTFHAANRFETEATETTVQYTFSDTNSTNVGIDGALRVVINDDQVFEAAEVGREGGYKRFAALSDTPNKTYSLDGLRFVDDRQSQQRAERIVFLYGQPRARTESWDVWPEAYTTHWPNMLNLDIGHRVGCTVTPGDVGSQISLQEHLEYIEHNVTPEDWVLTMNGSPVDDTDYFVWGGTGAINGWGSGAWR